MSWSKVSNAIDRLLDLQKSAEKLGFLKKVLLWISIALISIMAVIHVIVRVYIWPQIETKKESYEQSVSQYLGVTLHSTELKATWNTFWPAFELKNVTFIHPESGATLLTIPEIKGSIAWESFWHLKPYFHELSFANAKIQVVRNNKNEWSIAGIPLGTGKGTFANWLFDQDSIEFVNSEINWLDQRYQSSDRVIQVESLRLANSWLNHEINLKVKSSWHQDTASFHGQFRHGFFKSASNWQHWSGQFVWQIQDLDLKIVNQWVDHPIQINNGFLTTKGQAYLDEGILDGGKASVSGREIRIDWARIGKPLTLASLNAELEQSTSGNLMTISSPKITWLENKQIGPQELNDLSLYWKAAANIGSIKYAGIKTSQIEMALVEQLAKQFPLPKDLVEFTKSYQSKGTLKNLDVSWNEDIKKLPFDIKIPGIDQSRYKLAFEFKNVFLTPVKDPALAAQNLSGKIYATEVGGQVVLETNNGSVTFNKFLENDFLPISQSSGLIKWTKVSNHWLYEWNNVHILNEDLDLTVDGSYESKGAKTPDKLILKADLDRANVKNITRYFPVEMSKPARDYIRGSLLSGEINKGKLVIEGSPEHIPFANKKSGKFELYLPIQQVTYLPAPTQQNNKAQWSPFTNVFGTVQFNGPDLQLDFEQGSFESVKLTQVSGKVIDVTSKQATLLIRGLAQGHAQDLLNYYLASPSAGKLSAINEKLKLSGDAKLNLALHLPLNNSVNTTIEGEITLAGNDLKYGTHTELKEVNGNIFFSEEKIIARNLKAQWLGGNIQINSATQLPWQKLSYMNVSGSANFTDAIALTGSDNTNSALLKQIDGRFDYSGKLSAGAKGYDLNLDLKIDPMSSQLPAPFNKKAGQSMSAQFLLSGTNKDTTFEHTGYLKIGKLLEIKFAANQQQDLRVAYGINTVAMLPTEGTAANLVFDSIDLDAWQKWGDKNLNEGSNNKSDNKTIVDSITARFNQARFYDQDLKNITLTASHVKDLWQANITSSMATGVIQWRAAQIGLPQGKLTANLKRLVIENDSASDTLAKELNNRIQKIPALDITADELIFNEKPFGKMELIASNDKNDWKIDKFTLKTREAQANGTGKWVLPRAGKKGDLGTTELSFELDIENAGQLLTNLGFAKTVSDGSGKLVGKISWSGEPHKYNTKTLKGDLALDLAKGTILQVEPGVGRLLGVLSFQSVLKIATLDIGGVLKPVVAQGTPFDRITSKGTVNNGVATISDLTLKGPQGTIRLNGNANLISETQDMRITVTPNLNAGSASVAYTFVNPIVGLSTLVGQYLFADEVSKLFQLDYLVQGTWDKPQVIVLDRKGKPIDENQLKDIRDKSLLKQQQNQNKK